MINFEQPHPLDPQVDRNLAKMYPNFLRAVVTTEVTIGPGHPEFEPLDGAMRDAAGLPRTNAQDIAFEPEPSSN
jgi:hypothetical protein